MPQPYDGEQVRLLVLDVDGVLTDGRITLDGRGVETKSFHVRDGQGIRLWLRMGLDLALITGRSSTAVQARANELGIRHVFQGVSDKMTALAGLTYDLDIPVSEVAVMGDDLPDLPMMRLSGYPIAVADAADEVREIADYVTVHRGGFGAVREAIEHLLRAGDRWEEVLALYGA